MPSIKNFCREEGFSLVEIIAALAILGIVMVSFSSLFTGGYAGAIFAGRKTQALNLAQEKMEALKSLGYAALRNEYLHEDDYYCFEELLDGEGYKGFRRRFSLGEECIVVGEYTVTGIRVDVVVFYRGGEQSVSLTSFLKGGDES